MCLVHCPLPHMPHTHVDLFVAFVKWAMRGKNGNLSALKRIPRIKNDPNIAIVDTCGVGLNKPGKGGLESLSAFVECRLAHSFYQPHHGSFLKQIQSLLRDLRKFHLLLDALSELAVTKIGKHLRFVSLDHCEKRFSEFFFRWGVIPCISKRFEAVARE